MRAGDSQITRASWGGGGAVDMYYIELIHSNPRLQRAKDMDQDRLNMRQPLNGDVQTEQQRKREQWNFLEN